MDISTILQELIDSLRSEINKTEKEICAMQGALLMLKRQEQAMLAKKNNIEDMLKSKNKKK